MLYWWKKTPVCETCAVKCRTCRGLEMQLLIWSCTNILECLIMTHISTCCSIWQAKKGLCELVSRYALHLMVMRVHQNCAGSCHTQWDFVLANNFKPKPPLGTYRWYRPCHVLSFSHDSCWLLPEDPSAVRYWVCTEFGLLVWKWWHHALEKLVRAPLEGMHTQDYPRLVNQKCHCFKCTYTTVCLRHAKPATRPTKQALVMQ